VKSTDESHVGKGAPWLWLPRILFFGGHSEDEINAAAALCLRCTLETPDTVR